MVADRWAIRPRVVAAVVVACAAEFLIGVEGLAVAIALPALQGDPVLPSTGGPAGNAVLTAWTGAVLTAADDRPVLACAGSGRRGHAGRGRHRGGRTVRRVLAMARSVSRALDAGPAHGEDGWIGPTME